MLESQKTNMVKSFVEREKNYFYMMPKLPFSDFLLETPFKNCQKQISKRREHILEKNSHKALNDRFV